MAAETPGVLADILPVDSLIQGRVIVPVPNPEIAPIIQAVQTKFDALPEELKKELSASLNRDSALDYIPELWDSKEAYDAYIAAWKKNGVSEREVVVLGLKPDDTKANVWNIFSATVKADKTTAPLTLSALSYNAKTNVFESNNGILMGEEISEGTNFIFGAQTGYQWTLQKEDSFSSLLERVRITKSTDGKFIFVYYNFIEASKGTGKVIAQGSYSLRFPVKVASTNLTTPGQR